MLLLKRSKYNDLILDFEIDQMKLRNNTWVYFVYHFSFFLEEKQKPFKNVLLVMMWQEDCP